MQLRPLGTLPRPLHAPLPYITKVRAPAAGRAGPSCRSSGPCGTGAVRPRALPTSRRGLPGGDAWALPAGARGAQRPEVAGRVERRLVHAGEQTAPGATAAAVALFLGRYPCLGRVVASAQLVCPCLFAVCSAPHLPRAWHTTFATGCWSYRTATGSCTQSTSPTPSSSRGEGDRPAWLLPAPLLHLLATRPPPSGTRITSPVPLLTCIPDAQAGQAGARGRGGCRPDRPGLPSTPRPCLPSRSRPLGPQKGLGECRPPIFLWLQAVQSRSGGREEIRQQLRKLLSFWGEKAVFSLRTLGDIETVMNMPPTSAAATSVAATAAAVAAAVAAASAGGSGKWGTAPSPAAAAAAPQIPWGAPIAPPAAAPAAPAAAGAAAQAWIGGGPMPSGPFPMGPGPMPPWAPVPGMMMMVGGPPMPMPGPYGGPWPGPMAAAHPGPPPRSRQWGREWDRGDYHGHADWERERDRDEERDRDREREFPRQLQDEFPYQQPRRPDWSAAPEDEAFPVGGTRGARTGAEASRPGEAGAVRDCFRGRGMAALC